MRSPRRSSAEPPLSLPRVDEAALPTGNDYDPVWNAEIVRKILKDVDLTEKEIEKIAECAASHEGTKTPASLEAQIVHDADVIEKTGILGIIRHTWKLTNSRKIDLDRISTRDAREILKHIAWRKKQLKLPLSKHFASTVNASVSTVKAAAIVRCVAPLAKRGIITEKIVPVVSKGLTPKEKRLLNSQIKLGYLK